MYDSKGVFKQLLESILRELQSTQKEPEVIESYFEKVLTELSNIQKELEGNTKLLDTQKDQKGYTKFFNFLESFKRVQAFKQNSNIMSYKVSESPERKNGT